LGGRFSDRSGGVAMARVHQTVGGWVVALVLVSSPARAQQAALLVRSIGQPQPPVAGAVDAPALDWNLLLTRGGPLPDHERLLVVAADGGILASVDGDASRVVLPDALFARLCDERLRATLVHNHPDSVSLSGSDLIQLAKSGVERVIAVGHDGTIYTAEAAGQFGDGSALARDYSVVANHVLAAIIKEGRRGALDPVTFAPQSTHLVALVLARVQVIAYEVRPSLTLRLMLDRNRAAVDRIVDAEARRLKADRAAQGLSSSQAARR